MRADDTFNLAKELIIIHQRSSINDTHFPHQAEPSRQLFKSRPGAREKRKLPLEPAIISGRGNILSVTTYRWVRMRSHSNKRASWSSSWDDHEASGGSRRVGAGQRAAMIPSAFWAGTAPAHANEASHQVAQNPYNLSACLATWAPFLFPGTPLLARCESQSPNCYKVSPRPCRPFPFLPRP